MRRVNPDWQTISTCSQSSQLSCQLSESSLYCSPAPPSHPKKKKKETLAPKSHVAAFKMANLNGSPQSNLCCDKVFRLWHSTQRTCANNKLLPRAHRLKGTDGKWCRTVMILHFVTLLLLLLQQFSETPWYHYNHSTRSVLFMRRCCCVFFPFLPVLRAWLLFFFVFFGAFVAVAAWDCRLKQV